MSSRFWLKPLSLALSRRLYVYGAGVPAVLLLLAVVVLFLMHGSRVADWRLGATALAAAIMLACVCWAILNSRRYDLRISPFWALISLTALAWVYVGYGRNLLLVENQRWQHVRVQSIDMCARQLHISHPACRQLLEIGPGQRLDTDDVLHHLQTHASSGQSS